MIVEKRNGQTFNISGACNLNCVYCSGYPKEINIGKVKKDMIGFEEISLQGGEPLISKHLFEIIGYAKGNGIKRVNLITNGIALANEEFAEKVVSEGINEYHFAFPTFREKLSDELGQSENVLKRKMRGIKNLISLGDGNKIRIVHLIQKANSEDMLAFVVFMKKVFPEIGKIEFKFIQHFNNENNIDNMPDYTEIEKILNKTMELCEKMGIDFIVNGVPLCFMEERFHKYNASYENENSKERMEEYATVKSGRCIECRYSAKCIGVRQDYLLIKGGNEFIS